MTTISIALVGSLALAGWGLVLLAFDILIIWSILYQRFGIIII